MTRQSSESTATANSLNNLSSYSGTATTMDDKPSVQNPSESEIEALKKTTRISLEEALNVKPAPKKATSSLPDQSGEKKATGLISGILTHTAPIPQTIRLKRPSTSPIVINPPDITSAPTVVKTAHAKIPTSPIGDAATVIKKLIPPRPLNETSRIILDIGPQADDIKQKTAPIHAVSASEPTPGPKTIRLKRPSAIIASTQSEEAQVVPDMQTAKKSETTKIELPQGAAFEAPATQRKTIKIKRTDRNIIAPRTVPVQRQAEAKLQPETVIQKGELGKEVPIQEPLQDEAMPVFSILAGAAVVCLALLVYLLAAQAFGPKLLLPVPSGLF